MFLGWPSNRPVIYRSSKQDLPAKAAHKVNEIMSHQQLGSTSASELCNSASHQCSAAPGAQLSRPRGPSALNPIRQNNSGASAGNKRIRNGVATLPGLHVGQSGLRFSSLAFHHGMRPHCCLHKVFRVSINNSRILRVSSRGEAIV